MKTKLIRLLIALSACAAGFHAFAQGTAFTYQGRLTDNGTLANGSYDLTFALFSDVSGAGQVGGTLTNVATGVSNGLFTVTLDFGANFPGADRWLEIAARTNGGGAFSVLTPRQKITAAPYAITAGNVTGFVPAGQVSGNLPASQIGGVLTVTQLPTVVVTNNQLNVNLSGSFNGNGGSLTNLLTGTLSLAPTVVPVSLGHIHDGGYAQGVAVSGNFAYLANGNDGLRIYDISNPANPVSIGHTNDGGSANGVAVAGNFAYLANGNDGLRIYNISNPANPVSVGHIQNGDFGAIAEDVAVSGNFAYLANRFDGLRIYDISNPASPVNIGHANFGGAAVGVAVSGNLAYLADFLYGLRIYDISNPTNPVSVGQIRNGVFPAGGQAVAVSGDFAYLANYSDGLRTYDISNPASPVNIGHTNDGGYAQGVAVAGNFAYLANAQDGLRVYDISNPANPVNIGHIGDGGSGNAVAVAGNFAYLANSSDGLRIYAIGAVTAPAFQGNGRLLTDLDGYNLQDGTVSSTKIADGSVTSAKVLDDTIVNADISSSAAIADSKLATISTAGKVADTALSGNVALLNRSPQTFTGSQNLFDGAVGIGTTSPALKLSVAGFGAFDSANAAAILLTNTTATGHGWEWHSLNSGSMQLADFNAAATRVLVDTSGNVGIGPSTTPAATLDVQGDAMVRGLFTLASTIVVPTAGATVTPATSYIKLRPTATVTLSATSAIADGSASGNVLVLQNIATSFSMTINNGANTRLNSNRTLGPGDTLTLIWDGSDWVELSFANN